MTNQKVKGVKDYNDKETKTRSQGSCQETASG